MLPQSLHHVLNAYPAIYTPRHGESVGTAAGFSGARIVRLETEIGPFCLRGWPSVSLPTNRIAGLHRLLRHVFDAGVTQVAVPIAARNGETLVTCHDQVWQLEPWMPGLADFWINPSVSRLKNGMACLASFHQATVNYTDSGSARAWFHCQNQAPSPAVAERWASLREWQTTKLSQLHRQLPSVSHQELRELGSEFAMVFDRVAPFIGEQLNLLSRVSFRLQPCLRDVWHDHVLFSGDEVTGLIDVSACRSENIATDLARLLGSLLRDDQAAWETALKEYETHRPLTSHERALVQALDQSGVLLSGMAWLDRLVLQNECVNYLPRVIERLKHYRDRLQTLQRVFHGNPWQISSYGYG